MGILEVITSIEFPLCVAIKDHFCVRGTRTQPLICVGVLYIIGCPVQLIREVFLRLHFRRRRHTFASLWGACLHFASLWRAYSWWFLCPRRSSFKGLLGSNILSSYSVHLLKSLLNLRKAYIDLCLLNRPRRSSFRRLLLNFTLD